MVLGASIFPVFRIILRGGSTQSRRAVVSRFFSVYRVAFGEASIRYRRYMVHFGAVRKLLVQMPSDEQVLIKNRAVLRENLLEAGTACFVNDRVERQKL